MNIPVSPPYTPYDWLAVKETNRMQLDRLDFSDLAILYGLSSIELFRDKAFCKEVNAYLNSQPQPEQARYKFGYHLASSLWEQFWIWEIEIQPGGKSLEFPAELKALTMRWLLAGIPYAMHDEEKLQLIHWLKYRIGMADTSLNDEDIKILESAMGYKIDPNKDPHALALMKNIAEKFRQQFGQE